MGDLVHTIGSSPFGVSRHQQSMLAYWTAILIQKSRGLADSEGNLIGESLVQAIERTWATIGGAGVVSLPVPGASGTANVARLHDGTTNLQAIVGGQLAELRGSADGATLDVTLAAPPGTGTRTDLIFLETWLEEIQPTISPEAASAIVHKRGNTGNATPLTNDLVVVTSTETARRLQIRYALKAISSASALSGQMAAGSGYAYTAGPVVGEYLAGDGSTNAATALVSADGYRRAIVLATVARSAGVTTITGGNITVAARLALLTVNADRVDLFDANATPTANTLLPLDGAGKYPSAAFSSLPGSATDVDKVDGFDASATPTANTLLPLDSGSKYPNSVWHTGSGGGIDVDTVDAIHAASTPTANKLLALDSGGKFPNSALKTGTGNGLDADSVDGRGTNLSPTANLLLPLDSGGKFPNSALYGGTGGGIDSDLVDGLHAAASPAANKYLALDSGGQYPNSAFNTGSGGGIDVDLLDGLNSTALATSGHSSGATILRQNLVNSTGMSMPYSLAGSKTTELYSFPAGKNVAFQIWYITRMTMQTNPNVDMSAYIYFQELDPTNAVVASPFSDQASGYEDLNQQTSRTVCISGVAVLTNAANHFYVYGWLNTGNASVTYTGMAIYAWYF